jgi:prepilin-type N-terminal cleavage/methylation domain-containing protein/prepilin-type processing-associated H-X9-DG protein
MEHGRVHNFGARRSGERMGPRGAFTLVELLVVIGVIAILISLLLPALNRARTVSLQAKCLSNIRQIAVAVVAYAADNKGNLPRFLASNGGGTQSTLDENLTYTGTMLGSAGTLPVDRQVGQPTRWPGDWTLLIFKYTGRSPGVYTCPMRQWKTERNDRFKADNGQMYPSPLVSYRVNGASMPNSDAIVSMVPSAWVTPTISRPFGPVLRLVNGMMVDTEETMNIARVASDTILATECVRRNAGNVGNGSFGELSATVFIKGPSLSVTSISTSSHNGLSASFAYFDGHAETITAKKLLTQMNGIGSTQPMYRTLTFADYAASPNQGNIGDLLFNRWNNSDPPRGPWSAVRGD